VVQKRSLNIQNSYLGAGKCAGSHKSVIFRDFWSDGGAVFGNFQILYPFLAFVGPNRILPGGALFNDCFANRGAVFGTFQILHPHLQ
jgi:hypothetical protein